MCKKAHIIVNLVTEASNASVIQIKERIMKGAKIPWCKNIEEVTIEDTETSYKKLKNQGFSNVVARNIMDLYTK
jgi:hypothetical protein